MNPMLKATGLKRLKLKEYDELLSNVCQFCFEMQLTPLHGGRHRHLFRRRNAEPGLPLQDHGSAVQVDPIKSTLKPTGTKRLKVNRDILLSTFAFKIILSRFTMVRKRTCTLSAPVLQQAPMVSALEATV
jgi:hypothetical protein